jgi:GH24 family phage-related lysozyme (muramidase)
MKNIVNIVNRSTKVQLNQQQFEALVSLTFNAGKGPIKSLTRILAKR